MNPAIDAAAGTTTDRWSGFPPLAFTLEPDEARAGALSQADGATSGVIFAVLGVLNIVLGLVRYLYRQHDGLAAIYALIGCAYIAFALFRPSLQSRRRYAKPGSYTLQLRADGIAVAVPKPALIRWGQVIRVYDAGELFVITSRHHAVLALPKRIFDDRGAALWACLEDQLIGGYQLRRRPGSSVIVNTARNE